MRNTESRRLFGRRVIYTEVTDINEGNIINVLQKALFTHLQNQAEIDYLYWYYKGEQPILNRVKEVRPEINNMVVENRANEIVSFKSAYQVGEPIQYVSRGGDEDISSEVLKLNDYMLSEDKPEKDKELADWLFTCGTSYRMTLPDVLADAEEDEAPFEIFTLDPRYAFVVYSVGLGHKPMMGVRYVLKEDGTLVFSCWTETRYFEVWNTWAVIRAEDQILGIPIVEYPANMARLTVCRLRRPEICTLRMAISVEASVLEELTMAATMGTLTGQGLPVTVSTARKSATTPYQRLTPAEVSIHRSGMRILQMVCSMVGIPQATLMRPCYSRRASISKTKRWLGEQLRTETDYHKLY